MQIDPHTFYAQWTIVRLYEEASGWPGITLYEGGCINAWTAIRCSPGVAASVPKQVGVAVFSAVGQLNVTSADAYHALATKRVGSFNDLVSAIALGRNDGAGHRSHTT
jgi:hypothetical protein